MSSNYVYGKRDFWSYSKSFLNLFNILQRGLVHVYQSQWMEAKQCFLNSVSANPYHPEALRSLGEAHYILGEPRLAEKILKDAVKIDPNSPNLW